MTFSNAVHTLTVPDYAIMRRMNRWQPPRWMRWWMLVSTRGGDGWVWLLCGATVLASHDPARYAALCAAAVAAAIGILIFQTIKKAVGRRRPSCIQPHCWAKLLPPDQFSFPSGHSLTAFAVATSLALFYPKMELLLMFSASSVALSRIVLGLHFLSDVLAGSAIGVMVGYLAFRWFV
jgi:undecaprenyl-diphosphatase